MTMKTTALLALSLILITHSALARRAAPPDPQWFTPQGKGHHYSVSRAGLVTIVDAKDHKKVIWKATMTAYSCFFDKIHVVDGGKRIVCIRSNHSVHKVDQVAVETFTKDGGHKSFKASEFISDIVKAKPRTSIDPSSKWMNSVKTIDAKGIQIVNAMGEEKTVAW